MAKTLILVFINVLMDMSSASRVMHTAIRDYRSTGSLVGEHEEVRSFIECCVICEEFPTCKTANYNTASHICRLIAKDPDTVPLTPVADQGWRVTFKHLKDINPLFKATASHSQNHSHGPPQNALDGNTNGNYNANSCTHTKLSLPGQWWMADLHGMYQVSSVIMWNRSGTYYYRLQNLVISVANTTNDLTKSENICQTYQGPPISANDNPIRRDCTRVFIGRYLRIQQTGNGPLTLCEVQVLT